MKRERTGIERYKKVNVGSGKEERKKIRVEVRKRGKKEGRKEN